MKTTRAVSAILTAVAALSLGTTAQAISLDFVNVGDPGNLNDTSGYGGVNDPYAIGKYEVTLLQYTAFLNAVAVTDTYNLYNTSMGTDLNIAGISRVNSPGSYIYSVIGDGNRPVTYVSWFDAARFTNWLHNGQTTGLQNAATTEAGAYTLSGTTSGGLTISKNVGAQYWIPSENEWYKAAYYDPVNAGADANGTANYWLYPTQSDTAPGNVVGGSANQANYYNGVFSVTQSASYSGSQNYLTASGTFSGSASHYGTFDQGGNVWEWNNDAVIGSSRGLRGGSWDLTMTGLRSSNRDFYNPSSELYDFGFRVATVPEPNTVVSIIVGLGMLACWRKRPFSL